MSLPLELRANDIQKHILSIDSRFRQNPLTTNASNYYIQLPTPIKNVLRIRMTALEFPNNYPSFFSGRKNVSFCVLTVSGGVTNVAPVKIPDGVYTAVDMYTELNTIFAADGIPWVVASFDFVVGKFRFRGSRPFAFDTTYQSLDRPFDYGLGYYLGFPRGVLNAIPNPDVSGEYILKGEFTASFNGDNYILMKINDFECVRHTTSSTDVRAFAKIILRDPKTYVAFDDYASKHAKEVVFKAPQNLSRLHIQVLDPYGDELALTGINHSFSIEVLEIQNMSLYNSIRESLSLKYS